VIKKPKKKKGFSI